MKYLLDSNIINAFFDETSIHYKKVTEKILALDENDKLFVSVLTIFEFEYNLSSCVDLKKQHHIKSTINKLSTDFGEIGINKKEGRNFGEIKHLIKLKKGISPKNMQKLNIDIMIASSAISNSCVVVSGDKIFKTISKVYPQVTFENWLE